MNLKSVVVEMGMSVGGEDDFFSSNIFLAKSHNHKTPIILLFQLS